MPNYTYKCIKCEHIQELRSEKCQEIGEVYTEAKCEKCQGDLLRIFSPGPFTGGFGGLPTPRFHP